MAFPAFSTGLSVGDTELGYRITQVFNAATGSYAAEPDVAPVTLPDALFLGDGASGQVTGNGQHVFAGAGCTITVAAGVTQFTVAEWPAQTAWGVGTAPTGPWVTPAITAALEGAAGDEVTLATDGVFWFSSSPPSTTGGTDTDSYTHLQPVAAATWNIVHNLGYNPAGIVVSDPTGVEVFYDDVTYVNSNSLTLSFIGPQDGQAIVG